jgi:hypothetical protein
MALALCRDCQHGSHHECHSRDCQCGCSDGIRFVRQTGRLPTEVEATWIVREERIPTFMAGARAEFFLARFRKGEDA